jgi:hypothetical protein
MRWIILYFIFFLPFLSQGQITHSTVKIPRLALNERKSFNFNKGDSSMTIVIDTLIMKDKSKMFFTNKKDVKLIVHHAVIGKDCVIFGNDGKNNGTNIDLSLNVAELNSLFVNVSGAEANTGNRRYNNGNGGKVVLHYLASGIHPQTHDRKKAYYLSISNKGAGNTVNSNHAVRIIMDQIRRGSPGRPLTQFPNGRIYSGETGNDGATVIKSVDTLP